MGRIAAGFALEYPEVRLKVTTDDRPVDMIEEGYDLVIRVNPPPNESLISRAFLHDRRLVVTAPSLAFPETSAPALIVARGSADPRTGWTLRRNGTASTIPVVPDYRSPR